jgi:hypothetical protein
MTTNADFMNQTIFGNRSLKFGKSLKTMKKSEQKGCFWLFWDFRVKKKVTFIFELFVKGWDLNNFCGIAKYGRAIACKSCGTHGPFML